MTAGYRRLADGDTRLDWSRAGIGDPAPCTLGCGRNAILRHPITGRPCHKVCDDARAAGDQAALEQRLTGRATTHRTAAGSSR